MRRSIGEHMKRSLETAATCTTWIEVDFSAVERARKALRGDDFAEIRSAQEELTRVFSEAGQAFYAQQQAAPSDGAVPADDANAQPAGATAGKADDVVEADYEIVDDKK